MHLETLLKKASDRWPRRSALSLLGLLVTFAVADGQQRSEPDYPSWTRLYSADGRESLTATCAQSDERSVPGVLTCKFVNVRFRPPENDEEGPLEALESIRNKPLAEGQSVEAANQELARQLDSVLVPACEGYREMLEEATNLGLKTTQFIHGVLAACENKDAVSVLNAIESRKKNTCGLWVDNFELDMARTRRGQWIYRQERPGDLSKVLRIYELTGESLWWTLTETRVPTEGADEPPSQTVWKTRREGVYELPCDFIEHDLVQAQF